MALLIARNFAPMGVHVGTMVENRRAQLKVSKTALADSCGLERGRLARWLEQPSWDTDVLMLACKFLEFNFFEALSREYSSQVPNMSIVKEPESPRYEPRPTVRVMAEVDPANPKETALALEFAKKLRRIQDGE